MNFIETVRILKKMKKFLDEKNEAGNVNGNLMKAEITALENSIEFINMILHNVSPKILHKFINNAGGKNNAIISEIINNHEINNEQDYEILYADEIKIVPNHKVSCSLIKCNGKKYIVLEPRKMIRISSQWENWENFIFPMEILKENQSRKKIHAINFASQKATATL